MIQLQTVKYRLIFGFLKNGFILPSVRVLCLDMNLYYLTRKMKRFFLQVQACSRCIKV